MPKITSAIMMKFRMAATKVPRFTEAVPTVMFQLSKLTPPVRMEISGMMMSLTKELTMPVKAAPMIMPTARSMTFPLEMNSLNFFILYLSFLKNNLFSGRHIVRLIYADYNNLMKNRQ